MGLSKRDLACIVLPELDYEAQLVAIRHILRRHREADEQLAGEIRELEAFAERTSGMRNQRAVEEWTERMHTAVYQDAAHSMAALGMLAPLVESMFYQAFQGIKREFYPRATVPMSHKRWQQPSEDQWDCHFVWSKGRRSTNLTDGIMQLAESVGLTPHMPSTLEKTLQALFGYRNKMFHFGFEWPVVERCRFKKRIADWPTDWFVQAQSGGEPWVFYLSEVFIEHCLRLVDEVIDGIGAYCDEHRNIG